MNFGGLSFLGLGAGNVRSTVCVHVGDDRLGTFSLFTFLFLFGEAASHALTFQLFSSSASSDSSAFLTLLPFVGCFFFHAIYPSRTHFVALAGRRVLLTLGSFRPLSADERGPWALCLLAHHDSTTLR